MTDDTTTPDAPPAEPTESATAAPDVSDAPAAEHHEPPPAPETEPAIAPEAQPESEPTPAAAVSESAPEVVAPPAEPEPTPEPEPVDEPVALVSAETYAALAAPEEHVALPEHAEGDAEPEAPVEQPEGEAAPEAVKPKTRKPRAPKAAAAEPTEEPPADEPAPAEVAEAPAEPAPESTKKWYVVKVQSGREESIKSAIERKVKIEGLEPLFGEIAIPVEEYVEKKKVRVTDKKTGEKVTQEKNVTKARKKYPGYIFALVEFDENILYLFRETSGVGDFVGATGPMKPPPPMSDREVTQMLTGIVDKDARKGPKKTVVKLDFEKGDKVKIRDGAFANMEGEVKTITEPKDATETPKVTVVVSIFGRPVDVELDYWQVDKA